MKAAARRLAEQAETAASTGDLLQQAAQADQEAVALEAEAATSNLAEAANDTEGVAEALAAEAAAVAAEAQEALANGAVGALEGLVDAMGDGADHDTVPYPGGEIAERIALMADFSMTRKLPRTLLRFTPDGRCLCLRSPETAAQKRCWKVLLERFRLTEHAPLEAALLALGAALVSDSRPNGKVVFRLPGLEHGAAAAANAKSERLRDRFSKPRRPAVSTPPASVQESALQARATLRTLAQLISVRDDAGAIAARSALVRDASPTAGPKDGENLPAAPAARKARRKRYVPVTAPKETWQQVLARQQLSTAARRHVSLPRGLRAADADAPPVGCQYDVIPPIVDCVAVKIVRRRPSGALDLEVQRTGDRLENVPPRFVAASEADLAAGTTAGGGVRWELGRRAVIARRAAVGAAGPPLLLLGLK